MRFKILTTTILVFCFLFSFNSVLAIGVGAKPSSLDLDLEANQPKETKILVYNISQEAGIFQVSSDELSEWIKIEPNSFRLEAGESKEVRIIIVAEEGGRKTTNLSVLATPLNRQSFSALSGIKIPLRLNVSEDESVFLASILEVVSQDWIWLIWVLMGFLVGFYLEKYFKKRKLLESNNQNNNVVRNKTLDDL